MRADDRAGPDVVLGQFREVVEGLLMCLPRIAFVIGSDPFDPIICATHARRMTKF